MSNKAKHAFGDSERIAAALESGAINARDILFLDENTDNPKVGWITKDGKVVIAESHKEDVLDVEVLPESGEAGKIYVCGSDAFVWKDGSFVNLCKPTDVSELETSLAELETEIETKVSSETVQAMIDEKYSQSVINVVEF